MDTVTYPHKSVQDELSAWVVHRSDITVEPDLATTFEIAAIPTALLLDADGRVLERIIGFVQPGDFVRRLSSARRP